MMKRIFLCFVAMLLATSLSAYESRLLSPSKNIEIKVKVEDGEQLLWSVYMDGVTVMEPSPIALEIKGKPVLGVRVNHKSNFIKSGLSGKAKAVVPVKFRNVEENYNQLRVEFAKDYAVCFRAYDNGVAYRFETSFPDAVEVLSETSVWNMAPGFSAYWANEKNPDYITHCEANFQDTALPEISADTYSYLPVSMSDGGKLRAVITEADLLDYPNMMLRAGSGNTLTAEFPHVIDAYEMRTDRDVTVTSLADCIARTEGTRTYPWRVMTLGTDAELLENCLPWLLSSPEAPGDYSWIRPGKISWEWWAGLNVYGVDFKAGVNTDTYKYYIDFAAERGLEYILLDEGWSKSTLDIVNANPDLNLQDLICYGKSHGVGIVLWTLWTPMLADMEKILDTYKEWGVAGIKIDFMQMQDQNMVRFYEKVASECMKRQLLVDFHGAFKPAGLQRTYPNAMTFEGVYGMEHDKCSYDISPDHDLKLPFTRMVAGPMDYTPGAVNNATREDFAIRWSHPMSQGTRSHQAAIFVAFESPLMMLCDTPSNYRKASDFACFLSRIPTVWEETIAHEAVAGEYLVISRRTADGRWYSAALNNWNSRDLTLDTSFLGEGEWEAVIHKDGVNADVWAEDYKLVSKTVKAGDILPIHLANGGGWVAEFTRK